MLPGYVNATSRLQLFSALILQCPILFSNVVAVDEYLISFSSLSHLSSVQDFVKFKEVDAFVTFFVLYRFIELCTIDFVVIEQNRSYVIQ